MTKQKRMDPRISDIKGPFQWLAYMIGYKTKKILIFTLCLFAVAIVGLVIFFNFSYSRKDGLEIKPPETKINLGNKKESLQ